MSSRVYVGNLPSRATERDLEHFFRGFGRIRDIMMKNGFGFVEFEDSRDADDAVYEQNGRELCGERVIVEISRRRPGGRGGGYGGRDGRDSYRDGVPSRDGRVNGRYPPPMQTRYRMLVTNLSTRCSWQCQMPPLGLTRVGQEEEPVLAPRFTTNPHILIGQSNGTI